MKVENKHYRTIWQSPDERNIVQIIDQRLLPHEFKIIDLVTYRDAIEAISDMAVRGAPLIGGTAAWGMYLASIEAKNTNKDKEYIIKASKEIGASRPTAVNLQWAIDRILKAIEETNDLKKIIQITESEAKNICDEDVTNCENIGKHGLELIREIASKNSEKIVNILTHCNAGWLATIDRGTATAPIYAARDAGINVHVWVDETRPRNQGASLTAWEFVNEDIPHTLIVDNAGGHLMQHGLVDICIVGSDRTTRAGDVGNKIGTYLKALAAHDNNIPFYVALPDSTIDWKIRDGIREIPIEERDSREVSYISGLLDNKIEKVKISPSSTETKNFAFDVTPAKYVTGLITPRGTTKANEIDINKLYPEY
tara:strand:+ start:893 stop:1996 length:1104 start_codon:yes stop_codon:yes gene_type:complete